MFGNNEKKVVKSESNVAVVKEATELLLSANSVINGNVSTNKATVYGTIEGSLSVETSFVLGVAGVVRGPVLCESGDIQGFVNGNLTCQGPLKLSSTAKVTGDVQCSSLSIEPGAYFCGKVVCTEVAQ